MKNANDSVIKIKLLKLQLSIISSSCRCQTPQILNQQERSNLKMIFLCCTEVGISFFCSGQMANIRQRLKRLPNLDCFGKVVGISSPLLAFWSGINLIQLRLSQGIVSEISSAKGQSRSDRIGKTVSPEEKAD